jgi:hypothetical protein
VVSTTEVIDKLRWFGVEESCARMEVQLSGYVTGIFFQAVAHISAFEEIFA